MSPLPRPAFLLPVLIGGLAGSAQAVTPASREQIVCHHQAAFVGTVLQSQDRLCRLPDLDPLCGSSFTASASVRIDSLLQPSEGGVRENQSIALVSPVLNRVQNEPPGLKAGAQYLFVVSRADGGAFIAEVYQMGSEAWLRTLWHSENCRRWRATTSPPAPRPGQPGFPTG